MLPSVLLQVAPSRAAGVGIMERLAGLGSVDAERQQALLKQSCPKAAHTHTHALSLTHRNHSQCSSWRQRHVWSTRVVSVGFSVRMRTAHHMPQQPSGGPLHGSAAAGRHGGSALSKVPRAAAAFGERQALALQAAAARVCSAAPAAGQSVSLRAAIG